MRGLIAGSSPRVLSKQDKFPTSLPSDKRPLPVEYSVFLARDCFIRRCSDSNKKLTFCLQIATYTLAKYDLPAELVDGRV